MEKESAESASVRSAVAAMMIAAMVCAGCAVQQPAISEPSAAVHPLPFRGRLVSGNLDQLPPAVAMSLSSDSPITFSYREELTHDEHHTPMILSAINPLTYAGHPMGEYGVTAFASLSITDGNRVIGDYTAKTRVTTPYGMFSEPTHRELDDAARAAVRDEIDQKLYSDSGRLAESVTGTE